MMMRYSELRFAHIQKALQACVLFLIAKNKAELWTMFLAPWWIGQVCFRCPKYSKNTFLKQQYLWPDRCEWTGKSHTSVCEVNLTPRTVYLIAAVPEMGDEGERLTALNDWMTSMWAIQAWGEAKHAAFPIKVAARKWDCLTDTLEQMEPVISYRGLQTSNTGRNVINACLLVHLLVRSPNIMRFRVG